MRPAYPTTCLMSAHLEESPGVTEGLTAYSIVRSTRSSLIQVDPVALDWSVLGVADAF